MALTDPLQWVVIAVVVIVFVMWGPKKIPELARALGTARKEFNEGSKQEAQEASSGTTTDSPAAAASTGDALLDTAKKLGIDTEGKTREQISSEIVSKAKPASS